jgi:tight adherence protein C
VTTQMLITLGAVFVAVAMLIGLAAMFLLSRPSQGRRRLTALSRPAVVPGLVVKEGGLTEVADPGWNRLLNALPTSRGSTKRLRREMAMAGFESAKAGVLLSVTELVLPVVLGAAAIVMLSGTQRWLGAAFAAAVGYLGPGMLFSRRIKKRKRQVENGLADTLDLLVLCLEAGSSLDQAIVKASEELGVAYPALGDQLRILISEMRAGKPRLEAFRGLSERTQVDDVRALVAMLLQTDKFGTSVSQALRTHAEVCRTKRRQRAEERAQKVGVKLVFPLVFCLFPALYVVMLGPAYLQFMKVFVAGE